jgi:putative ABC transport system permease protein
MSFLTLLHEAWISISASRLRAFLAILGIVIGVGSVVLLTAIGAGSRHVIEEGIAKLGSNLLIITPGGSLGGSVRKGEISRFDMKDVVSISQLHAVLAAAPSTFPRQVQASSGKLNWSTQVTGTTAEIFTMRDWTCDQGDVFSGDDLQQSKRVAVIGTFAAAKLFPDEMEQGVNIVGRNIYINGSPFQIVGVLTSRGQTFGGRDQDDAVYVPITTAESRLWGNTSVPSIVQFILAKAVSAEVLDEASEEIAELLRQHHNLRLTSADDFTIRNLTSIMELATETTQTLSLLLGAIASISLVVGGIGIMNIMLVTVTERTREIGIRKAVGATEQHILIQFLLEAVLMSFIGSVIGLVIGIGGGVAIQAWAGVPVEYSPWSVMLALGVAAVIGVASGIYPARKAAKLQPIEALRSVGA